MGPDLRGGLQVKRSLFLALGALTLVSCGPIDYIHTVTLNATRAVAEAKTAEAEERAPYEYWSSVTYLHMAKERAAYADYEMAIKYGEKAEEMAKDARKLAGKRDKAPTPGSSPDQVPEREEAPPDLTLAPQPTHHDHGGQL